MRQVTSPFSEAKCSPQNKRLNVSDKQPIAGPMPHTPQWYQMRKYDPERTERPVVFGASEAAATVNQSKWTAGPLEIYLRKLGETEDIEDNMGLRMGNKMEPIILGEYSEKTGNETFAGQPMFFHPEHSFMAATPDAVAVVPETATQLGVESKASTYHMKDKEGDDMDKFGREGTDEVPVIYNWQCQQLMGVLGYVTVDIPVFFSIHHLAIYTVPRNDDMIDALVSAQKELAERIENRDPPEPNWTHSQTSEIIRNLHGHTAGKKIMLDTNVRQAWWEYQRLGSEIKTLEEERTECKNRVLHGMGDAELGHLSDEHEIRVCQISGGIVTEADVAALQKKIGQPKKKSHERVFQRKVK